MKVFLTSGRSRMIFRHSFLGGLLDSYVKAAPFSSPYSTTSLGLSVCKKNCGDDLDKWPVHQKICFSSQLTEIRFVCQAMSSNSDPIVFMPPPRDSTFGLARSVSVQPSSFWHCLILLNHFSQISLSSETIRQQYCQLLDCTLIENSERGLAGARQ